MLSHTRRALEDFDNQHEFERMAADILNALGYSHVEPMAPGGGADGGSDIRFCSGETSGVAFVTLDKKIKDKFKRDLAKHPSGEGQLALFCSVDVTPSLKLAFSRDANAMGYTLEVFDLERLRSLLDSSLKDIRRRYLGIDDAVATKLRGEIAKLLRFPNAVSDEASPASMLEQLLANTLPRRLFDLLMRYDERDVREVPGIGPVLDEHLTTYYAFRTQAHQVEGELMTRIGTMSGAQLRQAWAIHFRYAMMRFGGLSKEDIVAQGNFLNYGISWESAEAVFKTLTEDQAVASMVSRFFSDHDPLCERVTQLRSTVRDTRGS